MLSYLLSAATVRANEREALSLLPAVAVEEAAADISEDTYLNSVLIDPDAFIRATALTPVVRYRHF
jgi:hypothetical protein